MFLYYLRFVIHVHARGWFEHNSMSAHIFVLRVFVIPKWMSVLIKLHAYVAIVARGVNMCCLNMLQYVCLHPRGFKTVVALPFSSIVLAHFRVDHRVNIWNIIFLSSRKQKKLIHILYFSLSFLCSLVMWLPRAFLEEAVLSQNWQVYVTDESLKCMASMWQNALYLLEAPKWQRSHLKSFSSGSLTMWVLIASSRAAIGSAKLQNVKHLFQII